MSSASVPLITVIIPVHARVRFLDQAVGSVLQQTHPRVEVIVVDDGSPVAIAPQVGRLAGKVRFLRQANGGPGAARNAGLREAQGDYCLFLDDDDFLEPSALQMLLAAIRAGPGAAWAFGRVGYVNEEGSRLPVEHHCRPTSGDLYPGMIRHNPIATPSAVLLTTAVVRQAGGFDTDRSLLYCEDYDLWLSLARDWPAVVLPQLVTNYRLYSGQGTRNWARHYEARLAVLRKQRSRCRPGYQETFEHALAQVRIDYGDELYMNQQPRAARKQWRLVLASPRLAPGWPLRYRMLKSYCPLSVLHTLQHALRLCSWKAASLRS